jgi:DNA (cytosine-5)-methyltransferase 1
MKYIQAISLYSGAGLMDCGFINRGFEIVWGCEIEQSYVKAYNYALQKHVKHLKKNNILDKNYKLHTIPEDGVDITEVKSGTIIKHLGNDFFGIIGGPPCQDYSNGGKNKGVEGERGRLIHNYFEKVKDLEPDFFLFENVEGLIRTKKHKKAFEKLVNDFETIGYTVRYNILSALDYGIPQDRHRVFIAGFKNEIMRVLSRQGYIILENEELCSNNLFNVNSNLRNNLGFRWPEKKFLNQDPKTFIKWPAEWPFNDQSEITPLDSEVNDDKILESLGIPREAKELCVFNAFKGLTRETPNQIEHFVPKSLKFKQIREGDTDSRSFKRLHRFRYSPAVAYGNNEVHLHPVEPRRLTVREALRLQTAPDSFVLAGDMTLTDKFKVIGNGVPVKLAELIATEVKRTIMLYQGVQFSEVQALL